MKTQSYSFHQTALLKKVSQQFILFMALAATGQIASAQWLAEGNITRPDKILFDYYPSPKDQEQLFKSSLPVTSEQKEYLLRKLKPANRGNYKFREREYFTTEFIDDWKLLQCKAMRIFQSEASNERLCLVMIAGGDNYYLGKHTSYYLPVESDEYFVLPVSAFESWQWPGGKIPAGDFKTNELHNIEFMSVHRPSRYRREWITDDMVFLDPVKTMSVQTKQNLSTALLDTDLTAEVMMMGQLDEQTIGFDYSGGRSSIVKHYLNEKIHLVVYHLAFFADDDGNNIEILYCPWDENDTVPELKDFRGSTNRRDCYFFIPAGQAETIGYGNNLKDILARLIRAAPDGFKDFATPLLGDYMRLRKSYSSMGILTADDYKIGLITGDGSGYFLTTGYTVDSTAAQHDFEKAMDDLKAVAITNYGRLTFVEQSKSYVQEIDNTIYLGSFVLTDPGRQDVTVHAVRIDVGSHYYLSGILISKN